LLAAGIAHAITGVARPAIWARSACKSNTALPIIQLEDIETMLWAQGLHLEGSLLIRIKRNLAYYCERVQRENLGKPEPRTKNYPAHIEAWTKRPHGDHDETPAEWRQYK
jgi:hypothetical protein